MKVKINNSYSSLLLLKENLLKRKINQNLVNLNDQKLSIVIDLPSDNVKLLTCLLAVRPYKAATSYGLPSVLHAHTPILCSATSSLFKP